MATMAMSARISAYSARPWPSSSSRMISDEISAFSMWGIPPFIEARSECGLRMVWRAAVRVNEERSLPGAFPHARVELGWMCGCRTPKGRRQCRRPSSGCDLRLDGRTDRRQDLRDLAAQEDEGDDRDDRDQGEDERVLRETLA